MTRCIGDLMAAAVIVASPEETVGEVREKMSRHDIGAVPVVNTNGVLVGIVTTDDLAAGYETAIPVSRVMSAPVEAVPPSTEIREAARRMREHRHHHLVVIEEDRVVGMLSTFDLLRLLELRG